jgi:hypothetical protein
MQDERMVPWLARQTRDAIEHDVPASGLDLPDGQQRGVDGFRLKLGIVSEVVHADVQPQCVLRRRAHSLHAQEALCDVADHLLRFAIGEYGQKEPILRGGTGTAFRNNLPAARWGRMDGYLAIGYEVFRGIAHESLPWDPACIVSGCL